MSTTKFVTAHAVDAAAHKELAGGVGNGAQQVVAAAVAQVLSIDAEKGRFRQTALGVMGALLPTAFAYALRKEALWPVLAFLAVALLAVWLLQAQEGRRERRKALLLASGACVLVIAGLLGWRAIEVKSSGQDEYLAWQDARTRLVDYYDLSQIPPECYEAAGWTASTIERARSFVFSGFRYNDRIHRGVAGSA